MSVKHYVTDFIDFNYKPVVFHLREVNKDRLREVMNSHYVNHLYRLDNAYYMSVANCDCQDYRSKRDVYDQFDGEGTFYIILLHEDEEGFYFCEEDCTAHAFDSDVDPYISPLITNTYIFDCEVYAHDWVFVFKEAATGRRTIIHNDNDAVMAFMEQDPYLGGFNNKHYDNHILKAVMIGYTPEQIKEINDLNIIVGESLPGEILTGFIVGTNSGDILFSHVRTSYRFLCRLSLIACNCFCNLALFSLGV